MPPPTMPPAPPKRDACVGTGVTVGTNTDPDTLGPCEPGTSVMLEGIVWHETKSGEAGARYVKLRKLLFVNLICSVFLT